MQTETYTTNNYTCKSCIICAGTSGDYLNKSGAPDVLKRICHWVYTRI